MKKNLNIYCVFVLLLIIGGAAIAQKTAIYTHPDVDFATGHDLFLKEKYSSAQYYFQKTIQQNNHSALVRIDAEYFSALCAVELFHNDAEERLRNFIEEHPESPRVKMVNFYLGKYYYRKKKYNDAIKWFEKTDIYDLSKEEVHELYFKRGYAYFEQGKLEQAKKDFFEIKDIDTKYSHPANYYFSHIAYTERNYETALKGFQRLLNDETFAPIVPYYIAQLLFLQGKYDEVVKYAEPLLKDTNDAQRVPEISKIIAQSYYRKNNYKAAMPYFEKYKTTATYIGRNDWYDMGYCYYKTNSSNKAIECFQKSVNIEDSIAQSAYYHLADCYLKKNNKQQALNAFSMAYKLNFDKVIREDALFNYAKLSYELSYNPFSDAIRAFEQYLKDYPGSLRADEAYSFLVNVYLTNKNYEAGLRSIEKIKTLTPELKRVYQNIAYNRAVQLYNDNELEEAQKHFDKTLKYPADKKLNALAYFWKGEAYYKQAEKYNTIADFEGAIKNYSAFLYETGAADLEQFDLVNYNLGYAYFKQKDYANANSWFRKYVNPKRKQDDIKLNDACLRIADGFFVMKDYPNAMDYYEKALNYKKIAVDYALYQKALVLGLMGKQQIKSATLLQLLSSYKGKSSYEAGAKYELATSYELQGDNANAFTYFNKVVNEHPTNSYVSKAMLQIGNIQNKNKQYDAALLTLNKVVKQYPKTDVSLEAIEIIREVCKSKGDNDCLDNLKGMSPAITVSKLDSDSYSIARNYYLDEKYDAAYQSFSKYAQRYPDGAYILDAYFYRAEIDFRKNNFPLALTGYTYVIDKIPSKYTETSLVRAAYINFKNGNYALALEQYAKLEGNAESAKNRIDAALGLMRCHLLLKQNDEAINAANKVLSIEKLNPDLALEAHAAIAKIAIEKQDYDLAVKEYNTIIASTQSERASEAKYNIAWIQHQKKQYKEAQKTIFELINQKPSYSFWIAKGFLLLSDNYLALDDSYNAKFTLNNLIEKSTNPEIQTEAKAKLAAIVEKESVDSDTKKAKAADGGNLDFKNNNAKDSVLFKESKTITDEAQK